MSGLSGVQFILYEQSSCQQGSQWGAPIYCADKLINGDSVVITQLLQPSTTYYLLIDGFAGQHCNFDITLTNSGMQDCIVLPTQENELSIHRLNVFPIPSRDFLHFELTNAPTVNTQ